MENEQLTYNNLHWYEFDQNNSGGFFEMNDAVSIKVFIQSENAAGAIQKAEDVGIYFDGCESGRDCDCCGDRWYRVGDHLASFTTYFWRSENDEYDNISDYAQALANDSMWAKVGKPVAIVYFANGSIKRFYKEKGERHE